MRLRWLALALALTIAGVACDNGDGTEPSGVASGTAQTPAGSPTTRPTETSAGGSPTSAVTAATTGAGTTPTAPATTPTAALTSPAATPGSTTTPGATVTQQAAQNPMVDAAISDLAARISVARSTISLVEFNEVEWNDGSLGCPQPGMSYTQALVPGVRILLSAGGQEYAYHGRLVGTPFYCANPA